MDDLIALKTVLWAAHEMVEAFVDEDGKANMQAAILTVQAVIDNVQKATDTQDGEIDAALTVLREQGLHPAMWVSTTAVVEHLESRHEDEHAGDELELTMGELMAGIDAGLEDWDSEGHQHSDLLDDIVNRILNAVYPKAD